MSTPRIVLYGHFGAGNLGNDSSLEAMIHSIRRYQPTATITCVCTGPQVIAERFGIEALPVDISESRGVRRPARGELHLVERARNRVVDEIDFWLRRTRWLRSIDQFIVVGTGALDDMAVHPWNAPYDLFKWCRAAKLAGTRVVFLSVGAGPIVNWASRALMLGALRVADYRSYRDVASIKYVRSVGFDTARDHVYPDLVFSLPEKASGRPDTSSVQLQTVGLGVINYYGWRHDPRSGEPVYQGYLTKLKCFVHWLLDKGYTVRLLTGDSTDQRPVNELLDWVRTDGQADWQDRIFSEAIADVHDLFQQIANTDIVVASRFHNILCALMLGRPAISIGYHNKNDALLGEMGLQSYCQHIEHFSVDQLIQRFQSLASELSQASQHIQHKCAQYRQMLDEQYRTILRPEAVEAPDD